MQRLNGFDGMRAIACLAVLVHHLYQRNGGGLALRVGTDLAEAGVSLFFVLSGALLSYPFWQNYVTNESLPNLKHYAIHRAARIVPAFYLVLIVTAVASFLLMDIESPFIRMFAAMAFVAPYHYLTFFPNDLNGPLWSIGLEVSCYVLLPLFLFVAWKLGRRHWLKPFIVVVCGIALLQILHPIVVDRFMIYGPYKGWQFGIIGGAKMWLPYWNVTSFMGQFLCGALASLGIAVVSNRNGFIAHWVFDVFAVISLGLCYLAIEKFHPYSGSPSPITAQPYGAPVLSLACGLTLFSLALSRWVYRVFDNRLFRKVATLSFGVYLWHMLVIEVIHEVWVNNYVYNGIRDYPQWLMLSVIVTAVSFLIATLSFYYFEKPILEWARRKTSKQPS